MRNVRQVPRLSFEAGLGPQQVSLATGLPRTTVRRYLEKAAARGVGWPLPDGLDDRLLEEQLFGRRQPIPASQRRPLPDWETVHRELRRPHVTLQLLWAEYKAT